MYFLQRTFLQVFDKKVKSENEVWQKKYAQSFSLQNKARLPVALPSIRRNTDGMVPLFMRRMVSCPGSQRDMKAMQSKDISFYGRFSILGKISHFKKDL